MFLNKVHAFRISEQLFFNTQDAQEFVTYISITKHRILVVEMKCPIVVYLPFDSLAGNLVKWAMSLD